MAWPGLARYVAGWKRPGDAGVIALDGDRPAGVAWYRRHPPRDPGYGFVAADIPELGLAVFHGHRSAGTGRVLLEALVAEAVRNGERGLSLSVAPCNIRALRLYLRTGFRPVGRRGTSTTMLLRLR